MKNEGLGNPLILAAAAPAIGKASNNTVEYIANNGKNIVTLAAFAVAVYYGRKEYIKWSLQKYLENNGDNPDVITAMIFYKAMHKDWKIDTLFWSFEIPDGTNVTVLNQFALKVNSLENVVKAYKKIFRKNLHSDIRSEVNTKEMIGFYERLKAKENQIKKEQISFKDRESLIAGQYLIVTEPKGTLLREAIYNPKTNTITKGSVIKRIPYGESAYKIKQVLINTEHQRISYVVDIPLNIFTDGIIDGNDVSEAD